MEPMSTTEQQKDNITTQTKTTLHCVALRTAVCMQFFYVAENGIDVGARH
jgi:hypothetical protein